MLQIVSLFPECPQRFSHYDTGYRSQKYIQHIKNRHDGSRKVDLTDDHIQNNDQCRQADGICLQNAVNLMSAADGSLWRIHTAPVIQEHITGYNKRKQLIILLHRQDTDSGTVVQYIKFDIIGKDKGYGCDQRIHYHKKPVKDFLVVFYHMGHPICKSEKLLFNDFILQ